MGWDDARGVNLVHFAGKFSYRQSTSGGVVSFPAAAVTEHERQRRRRPLHKGGAATGYRVGERPLQEKGGGRRR